MDYQLPLHPLSALISWPRPNARPQRPLTFLERVGQGRTLYISLAHDETAIFASSRHNGTAEICFFNICLSLSRCTTRGFYASKKRHQKAPSKVLRLCVAFFGITCGIFIYTLQFTLPEPLLLNSVGDSIRILGLATLLAAFFLG